ncbi:MAG: TPM domain-containing protein, partial [Vicinamibacterales bacterium]
MTRPRTTDRYGLRRASRTATLVLALCLCATGAFAQSMDVPALTRPVNDFAGIVDAQSAGRLEQTITALQAASGDVIVVATVPTVAPFADIREYAVKMFQNGGRGIGQQGKDNGLLVLVAVQERRVWVEVGYGIEPFITDGFSGQVSRELMTPYFRTGDYGGGLVAGTNALASRIAQGRNVQLQGVPQTAVRRRSGQSFSPNWLLIIFIVLAILGRFGGGGPRRGVRGSGWSSGVG